MKKLFEEPELRIRLFTPEDILCTSGMLDGKDEGSGDEVNPWW